MLVASEEMRRRATVRPHGATSAGRILIVEDDDLVRRTLTARLAKAGWGVTGVACAEGALRVLVDGVVDCVLTDFMLPGMNGAAFGRLLQRRWPDLRVVLMTGYSALYVDCTEFPLLRKPFTNSELISVLPRLAVAA